MTKSWVGIILFKDTLEQLLCHKLFCLRREKPLEKLRVRNKLIYLVYLEDTVWQDILSNSSIMLQQVCSPLVTFYGLELSL